MMSKFFKKFYWAIIVVAIIAVDQLTKYLIASNLELHEEVTVIPNFFSIAYVRNEGIAFGMLSDFGLLSKILVMILTSLMIVVAILMILKKFVSNPISIVAVSFIIGGGIGNLIDRAILQYVVDFFAFTFWGRDFAIFNVADIFVTVGTILLILCFFFFEKEGTTVKENVDGNQEL